MSNGNLIATAAVLIVSDLWVSTEWYVSHLGFTAAKLDWNEQPTFSLVEREGAAIMLKQSTQKRVANRHLTPGDVVFDAFVWVRNLRKIEMQLKETETPLFAGPTKRAYGCTEIMVLDPDDYLICFGYCP